MKYVVVIEKAKTGFSAYSPDVSGCGVAGDTRKEVAVLMKEALEIHLEGLREEHQAFPEARASSQYPDVAAPA